MALEHIKTQLLLLHSQQSALDALGSLFNDHFAVHFATTGTEALCTLSETPIHIIVSAQDLPGMSGLEALREAKKRAPDMIGILLAGERGSEDIEALVGEQEVFQIVRGPISAKHLVKVVENAASQVRMLTISESANDNDSAILPLTETRPQFEPGNTPRTGEHIIMETMDNGASVVTDATDRMRALDSDIPHVRLDIDERTVDVLVLTKDQELFDTIRTCARGVRKVHHAATSEQAQDIVAGNKIGVLVTDAAITGKKVALLTQHLRIHAPRLVAVVAGRRDDGESLMEMINQGQVYRFLLKPVSPGRARLAVEASVNYHLEAPDSVFSGRGPVDDLATPANGIVELPVAPIPQPTRPAAPAKSAAASSAGNGTVARTDKYRIPPGELFDIEPGKTGRGLLSPFVHAAIAAGLLLAVGGWYFLFNPNDGAGGGTASEATPTVSPVSAPEIPARTIEPEIEEEPYLALLDNARYARDTGRLLQPEQDNALDWYLQARLAAPDNAIVRDELAALVDQVIGTAETAMLENRPADVDFALQMVARADPDNARLAFLRAQRDQQQLRSTLDEARAVIRSGRYADAERLLSEARTLPGANATLIEPIADDLATALREQRLEQTLALANERVANGQLIAPTEDNARYYFELAANNVPGNVAAEQGLLVVAGKLVLNARALLDNGELVAAASLLNEARTLDPESLELQATELALQKSLDAQAAAANDLTSTQESESEDVAVSPVVAESRAEGATAMPAASEDKPATTASQTESPANPAATAMLANNAAKPDAAIDIVGDRTAALGSPVTARPAREVDGPDDLPVPDEAPVENNEAAVSGPVQIDQIPMSQLTRKNYVAPRFPRNAQRRNVSGWVDVGFTVTATGTVSDLEIIDSFPGSIFNNAALDAVEQWRFDPVFESNRPVPKRVAVRLSFRIE